MKSDAVPSWPESKPTQSPPLVPSNPGSVDRTPPAKSPNATSSAKQLRAAAGLGDQAIWAVVQEPHSTGPIHCR